MVSLKLAELVREKNVEAAQRIRPMIKAVHTEIWELEQRIAEKRKEIRKLQNECPHPHTYYVPDASGNNDSYDVCKDCEKSL